MNRTSRRAAARAARSEDAAWPATLQQVPRASWPDVSTPGNLLEVWRSATLIVQVFKVWGHPDVLRISVQRVEAAAFMPRRDRVAPLTWDELQEVKAQVGRGDRWAVEVYPPGSAVVNVAPMRHLWLVSPQVVGWAWKTQEA